MVRAQTHRSVPDACSLVRGRLYPYAMNELREVIPAVEAHLANCSSCKGAVKIFQDCAPQARQAIARNARNSRENEKPTFPRRPAFYVYK